jgi:hypothetical protein
LMFACVMNFYGSKTYKQNAYVRPKANKHISAGVLATTNLIVTHFPNDGIQFHRIILALDVPRAT